MQGEKLRKKSIKTKNCKNGLNFCFGALQVSVIFIKAKI